MLNNLIQQTTSILFPARCMGCNTWDTWLCNKCETTIQHEISPRCLYCSELFSSSYGELLCNSCLKNQQLCQVFAYSKLTGAMRSLIHAYKYEFTAELHEILSAFLINYLNEQFPELASVKENYMLIPIPLHPQRLLWRGFNQSLLLAQSIGKNFNIPVVEALIRIIPTESQMQLLRTDRFNNVQNAFALNELIDVSILQGKSLLIIDDVVTTSATIQACARLLMPFTNSLCGLALAHGS